MEAARRRSAVYEGAVWRALEMLARDARKLADELADTPAGSTDFVQARMVIRELREWLDLAENQAVRGETLRSLVSDAGR